MRYSKPMRYLHWGMAFLVLIQVQIALTVNDLAEGSARAERLAGWHMMLGVVIGAALLARIWFRLRDPAPPIAGPTRWLAHLGHAAIYAALGTMVVSGYLKVALLGAPVALPVGLDLPAMAADADAAQRYASLHTRAGRVFIVLLGIHIAAAMLQRPLLGNDVMSKMLPASTGDTGKP